MKFYIIKYRLTIALVAVLIGILYVPVLFAWSAKKFGTGFNDETSPDEYIVIDQNWPIRRAPYIYNPLIHFHAWANGWKFYGRQKYLAYPEPEGEGIVYSRRKAQ